jgi:hypothetical protein
MHSASYPDVQPGKLRRGFSVSWSGPPEILFRRILINRRSEQLQDLQRMPALLPQCIGDRSNQLLREHVVSFRSEVYPISLVWFAVKHCGWYHNDPDAHSS